MEFCRVCLSGAPSKDIYQLKSSKKDGEKPYSEILSFCLDIKISANCKITKKLCTNCFKKILTFYKFKTIALKNDAYLKSMYPETQIKSEPVETDTLISISDDTEITAKAIDNIEVKAIENTAERAIDDTEVKVEMLEEEFLEDYIEDFECIQNNEKTIDFRYELVDVEDIDPQYSKEDTIISVSPKRRIYKQRITNTSSTNSNKNQNQTKNQKKPAQEDAELKTGPGICDQCGATVKDLLNHSLVHIPRDKRHRYPCAQCQKAFLTQGARKVHINRKHLGKLDHCDLCNKDFACLKIHMLLTHTPEKLPLKCELCESRFTYKSALDRHMTLHTQEKPFQCHNCGQGFRLKAVLEHHILSVHERVKNFVCPNCSKSFYKKYHFDIHMRRHTKERPYQCPHCSHASVSSTALKAHHRSKHALHKEYHCTLCDHSFATASRHTKERPYQCPHCSHASVSSTALKAHHRSKHALHKEYHCTLCDHSFATASTLNMHMRAHRKLKPYACRHCGVSYARTFDRNRHERNQHPTMATPKQ